MSENPSAADQVPRAVVCVVEVSSRTYAVEIGQAREARVFHDCTAVPLGPPHLIGMTNVRGAIIPVVDLRPLLGLPTQGRPAHWLIVEASAVRIALSVDHVHGVESVEGPLQPSEGAAAPEYLRPGRLRRNDDVVPILDVAKIVASLT